MSVFACVSRMYMRLECHILESRFYMICLTSWDDTYCERVYSPWPDHGQDTA